MEAMDISTSLEEHNTNKKGGRSFSRWLHHHTTTVVNRRKKVVLLVGSLALVALWSALSPKPEPVFQALGVPLPVPLQPPFRIFQVGHMRTGSTYQMHLLDAIAQVKTKGKYTIGLAFGNNIQKYKSKGMSFIFKTHAFKDEIIDLRSQGEAVIFTSGLLMDQEQDIKFSNYTLYNQDKANLYECEECEVDKYRDIFELSGEEIALLKEYMRLYSMIRKCCGFQMSQYEIARLNGCNMTKYIDRPEYPHCERIDKAQLELDFLNQPIIPRSLNPQFNWVQPGDCARFDEAIAKGRGFNNRTYNVETDCPK